MPPNSTHESVKALFKQFGDVVYVSLPKYRTSGRIKEFAFVEFADKNSVEQCINAFRLFDGVISDTNDPEKLKSVSAYVKEQEELEKETPNGETAPNDDEKPIKTKATDTKVEDVSAEPDSAAESDVESISSQPLLTKRSKLDVDSPSLSESKDNEEKSVEGTGGKKKR